MAHFKGGLYGQCILQMQIMNHMQQCENFKNTCKISALKDDGVVSKEESKILSTIEKETDAYVKQLKKLL